MTLASTVRGSWHDFLSAFEGLRPELYRYCRHLTRSPWDAEDLAQEVLARAFVTLGKMGATPPNPRAWLFRVASNAWIDQQRRTPGAHQAEPAAAVDPRATRGNIVWGMMFGSEKLAVGVGVDPRFVQGALASPPRREIRVHRGEPIVLVWYAHQDGEFVRAIDRIVPEGDHVTSVRNYFFSPEVIAEVCAELGFPCRSNGYLFSVGGC